MIKKTAFVLLLFGVLFSDFYFMPGAGVSFNDGGRVSLFGADFGLNYESAMFIDADFTAWGGRGFADVNSSVFCGFTVNNSRIGIISSVYYNYDYFYSFDTLDIKIQVGVERRNK